MDWQPTTVISFGKNYLVLLADDPASWFLSGNLRSPTCIAACEEGIYVCTNGGTSPQEFFQCFVEFSTGKLAEGRLLGCSAYTNNWEIVIPHQKLPPRTLLKCRRKENSFLAV